MKLRSSLFVTSFILLTNAIFSSRIFACTGIYIGKKVSTDGTYIIGRSNDYPEVIPNHMVIVPEEKNAPGRKMAPGSLDGITVEIPAHTYKYTGTPFMSSVIESGEADNYDHAVCMNDHGVVMSATVSAFASDSSLTADPYVETGLIEDAINQLIICQVKTAKEGVKLLASLIDEYGMSSSETMMIADSNEAWYMEMYTGHQYAAVKLPDDKVACYGNEFSLQYLSDYKESICSPDIEKLPASKKFAVYGRKNELNLLQTYSGTEIFKAYSHLRTWIGHEILAAEKYGKFNLEAVYDFTFKPKSKISVNDVMKLFRNRYEDTEYCPDGTDVLDSRVIGSETSLSVHIVQMYPDLPEEMSCVTWECTGPAVCGAFVPLSNACTSVSNAYGNEQPSENYHKIESEKYPYYASKECTSIAVSDFNAYVKPVQEYWTASEKKMTETLAQILKECKKDFYRNQEKAGKIITEYCSRMQENAFEDQKEILQTVKYAFLTDSNSMKMGHNPETGEVLTEKRVLNPVEFKLDNSKYTDRKKNY